MSDSRRQTGRTRRTLLQAFKYLRDNKRLIIFVVAAHLSELPYMRSLTTHLLRGEIPDRLRFITLGSEDKARGHRDPVVLLWDHHAYDKWQRYSPVQAMTKGPRHISPSGRQILLNRW